MTSTTYAPLGLWGWLLDARMEQLFDLDWILREGGPLRNKPLQQSVPVFDWMEQRLIEESLTGQTFQKNLNTFLAVWEWKKFPSLFGIAASRMLVRLLRHPKLPSAEADWVREKLDNWLPHHAFCPPAMSFTSAKEIGTFIKWEQQHCLGRHRLLFPVYFERSPEELPQGALVAAEVSVVEYQQATEAIKSKTFILAPWTWFTWNDVRGPEDDDRLITFDTVTNDLRAALIKSGKITGDGPIGCQVDNRSVRFVIDLQPLSKEKDFAKGGDDRALQAQAWLCGSSAFSVGGDSMGLTLAFAVWAASERLAVRPVIATGKVEESSKINSVDGRPEKCEAIDRFCAEARLDWWRVFPFPWMKSQHINRNTKYPPQFPLDLREAFIPNLLIDGFDDYRAALGVQGSNPSHPIRDKLNENYQLLTDAPAELPPESTGFIAADRAAAEQVYESLKQWLKCSNRATAEIDLDPLVAPFRADSQVFADWLLLKLLDDWPERGNTSRLSNAPVIVSVPLAGMVQKGDSSVCTLSDRLVAAMESRFGKLAPTSDQMAIALRNPGKLVLLVYPPASLAWWESLTSESASGDAKPMRGATNVWDDMRDSLRSLKNPEPDDRVAKQVVVWICSDLHHQYRWFGKPSR